MLTPNQIMAFYGSVTRRDISDSLKQSKENAGTRGHSRAWYFDCYMSQIAHDAVMDSRAARAFERNAYGASQDNYSDTASCTRKLRRVCTCADSDWCDVHPTDTDCLDPQGPWGAP